MNALARAPTPSALEDTLIRDGFYSFGEALDADDAARLLQKVRAARSFGPNLFLSQETFEADPQFKGVNPRPGRNLTERFDADCGFVEKSPVITGALTHILGADYKIIDRKFVCGVPEKWIPDWLLARIKGNPVNNLGAYVKPEFRDITYFYGIDFHQDLIDHPDRTADFITLYVYLHPVTREDAPLHVLPRSHQFGGTTFPHDLLHDGHERWLYKDRRDNEMILSQNMLTGGAGYAALWHACTLHGTQPDVADRERISLRYIIQRGQSAFPAIDRVNAMLRGPLSLKQTRVDLDVLGVTRMKTNHITDQT